MDMLVKLYDLPQKAEFQKNYDLLSEEGIEIRRAIAPERHIVVDWVKTHFNPHWASEVEAAFSNNPISCFIAIQDGQMKGFACVEATCKAFFGPTGVDETMRGKGIGKLLLIETLHELKHMGYAYGFIGGIGPAEFYEKVVGASLIEGSTPGIYKNMLR
ncbi:GNAT family N-acetyltransferase [Sediminitomix flava]|uniref:Acetyltransferase (GNAT) family protein n=1 Tax=Sediminitomix flava TaxID=379075 RepID=A0A315ZFM9_SEDFL|nr:GNAT family N-acetyltransferase [Sediminitomix flava]PWJ44396.1 acetyltransferase (GNAT) family protein [Sediminitomix flava]